MQTAPKGYWLRRSGVISLFFAVLIVTQVAAIVLAKILGYIIFIVGSTNSFVAVFAFPTILIRLFLPLIVFLIAYKITRRLQTKNPIEKHICIVSTPVFLFIVFSTFFACPLLPILIIPKEIAMSYLFTGDTPIGLIASLAQLLFALVWLLTFPTFVFLAIRQRKTLRKIPALYT